MNAIGVIIVDWLRLVKSQRSFQVLATLSVLLGLALALVKFDADRIEFVFAFDLPLKPPVTRELILYQILNAYVGIIPFITAFVAVFATGGVIPEMMRKGRIEVLLAKPVHRWQVVLGCYLGGIVFAALIGAMLIASTWIGLAARGTFLSPWFFLNVLILVAQYAIIFAVTAWLGFLLRSGGAAIVLTLTLWFAGKMVNTAMEMRETLPASNAELGRMREALHGPIGTAIEVLWWILPKPAALTPLSSEILDRVIGPGTLERFLEDRDVAITLPQARPFETALSSGLMVLVLLTHASRRLGKVDL